MRYWAVRLGEGGRYVEQGWKGKFIAIGWNNLGDLGWLTNAKSDEQAVETLTKLYEKVNSGKSKVQVSIDVGQIFNFAKHISKDDIVFVPDPLRKTVRVCKVRGNPEYRNDWNDGCDYNYRKHVDWLREFKREGLPQKLKDSLTAHLTVFNLDRHSQTIQEMLTGTPSKSTEVQEVTGVELAKAVIGKLMDFDPKKFQDFISHLLGIVGFEAATTTYVGDKGIDVVGTLNAEGLTTLSLHVQVKRVSGSIGIDEVLKIRGTLGSDDHGSIMTTAAFTRQAQEEAVSEQKKQITLIDGESLVDLILEHYDELDEEYKNLLPVKPKELPLTERFTMSI